MADHDTLRPLPSIAKPSGTGTGLTNTNINTAPTRSQTNPPEQEHERPHLHRRLHSNTITGRVPHVHRRNKSSGKESLLSATELKPPISFDGLLGRDKGRKGIGEGLRESGLVGRQQQFQTQHGHVHGRKSREYERAEGEGAEERRRRREVQVQALREAEKRVKVSDVARAQAQNTAREEELRRILKQVEEMGMSSTRRLDDTYYSILEKISLLHSTVASLKLLVEESRTIHKRFEDDSAELGRETKGNLDGFAGFEQQEQGIEELVQRLKRCKRQTEELDGRLEGARQRVEVVERRDRERRVQRTKRWRVVWGSFVGLVVLVVTVLVLRNRKTLLEDFDGVGSTAQEVLGRVGEEVRRLRASETEASPSEHPYLRRLFDEL